MAVGRISGPLLKANLGVNKYLTKKLSINTDVSYSIGNNSTGYNYGAGFKFVF